VPYLVALALDWPGMRLITKPVPALALGLLVAAARRDGYGRALAAGLFLSALGDVLLELPGRFLAGLAAFLAAHVAYTVAFVRDAPVLRPWRAVPFAAWLLAAFLGLRSGLGDMTIPVVAYMLAIGAMMWRAAARVGGGGAPTPGQWSALVGAILFGLSDTLIAFDRFHAPIPGAGYAIILLYWAGQAGIAASGVRPHPDGRTPDIRSVSPLTETRS
jgi:alkenylglycerophosphocholine/alkenylglycerophosphoethanolamine hydrolase